MVKVAQRSKALETGLTLAEVLMAVGLLSSVLILLVGVFLGGLKLMGRSEVMTSATTVAREVMETLQDQGGFGALPDGTHRFDGAIPDARLGDFPPAPYPVARAGGRDYQVLVEVQSLSADLRAVLVTVSWESGRVQLEKAFHAGDAAH